MTVATLFAPKVRYASTFDSQFEAMTTWRAEVELAHLVEDGGAPDVLAGHAEFVIVRVGEHPIDDLLDSLSDDVGHFAVLFEGDDVADVVQDQFDDSPFNRVLILTEVTVAAPLRGHGLEAWLLAEVIDRMASPTDTLVLLHPDRTAGGVGAESRFWRRVGLVPLDGHPEFVGQTTAYTHLPNARAALRAVADVEFDVPTSQLRVEPPDARRRQAIVADAEPETHQRLRLVRDH